MRKQDIVIGATYVAKVSGQLVHVRIKHEHPSGGWEAVNTTTGRMVRIKTAARLRRKVEGGAA